MTRAKYVLQWYIYDIIYVILKTQIIKNLTQNDAKTLIMNLTYILSLISSIKKEYDASCKNHFQPK